MEILFIIALITKVFSTKKAKFRKTSRQLKKELKFWNKIMVELVHETNKLFKLIFIGISIVFKKCICQGTVEEVNKIVDLPENVIKFDEYKLKKAK